MTVKARKKICNNCNTEFIEKPRESNFQWENRFYCSMQCNNSSSARKTDIFIRLERMQIKTNGCWKWCGTKDRAGYGSISSRKGRGFSPEKAHRVSYEKEYGDIPNGLLVCHKCDNPECTNPKHLFLGTQRDNMIDCAKKGRMNEKTLLNLIPGGKGYLGAKVSGNEVKK